MAGFLANELTSFALCWRLERRDGVALGFTSHDRDLTVEGLIYRASPGIAPSAIEDAAIGEASAFEVAGAVSAASLSDADLRAGRWDGARMRLLAVDWHEPSRFVQLARGELGGVTVRKGAFTADVKGAGAVLDRPVIEETSPECRAELGDVRCRVALAARTAVARIVSVTGASVTLDRAEPVANGWGWGRLRWLDGRNGGLTQAVLASAGTTLTLAAPPRFAVMPGTRAELVEGCDKSFETCRTRFANAVNFRGEPHLPGLDLLTRYPGE